MANMNVLIKHASYIGHIHSVPLGSTIKFSWATIKFIFIKPISTHDESYCQHRVVKRCNSTAHTIGKESYFLCTDRREGNIQYYKEERE